MINFFPEVLASNAGETISEKGIWRSSVTPCLVFVAEVAQEIWCMASVGEWRESWGSITGEEGSQAAWHTTLLYFPQIQADVLRCLQSLHISALWLCTLPGRSAPVPGWHLVAPAVIMSAGFCLCPAQVKPFVELRLMLAVTVFS